VVCQLTGFGNQESGFRSQGAEQGKGNYPRRKRRGGFIYSALQARRLKISPRSRMGLHHTWGFHWWDSSRGLSMVNSDRFLQNCDFVLKVGGRCVKKRLLLRIP